MTRPVCEASTPAPRDHSGRDDNGRGYPVPGEDMRRAGACAADGREAGACEARMRDACLREAGIPADSGHAEAARIRCVRFHRKPAKVPSRRGTGLISLIVAIGKPSLFRWSEPGKRLPPLARLGCDSSGIACGVKGGCGGLRAGEALAAQPPKVRKFSAPFQEIHYTQAQILYSNYSPTKINNKNSI